MVDAGKYKFGELQKKHLVRILRTNIVVRVGGGWETLDSFLCQHDPCRVGSGRGPSAGTVTLPAPGQALGLMSANLTTSRVVTGHGEPHKGKTESSGGTTERKKTKAAWRRTRPKSTSVSEGESSTSSPRPASSTSTLRRSSRWENVYSTTLNFRYFRAW